MSRMQEGGRNACPEVFVDDFSEVGKLNLPPAAADSCNALIRDFGLEIPIS